MNSFASKLSGILSAFSKTEYEMEKRFNSVIVVAAGKGSRMGEELGTTKQLAEIEKLPVIVRTIQQFDSCPFVNEIVVVARKEEIVHYNGFIKRYDLKKIRAVVAGGETRQDSVLNGFKAVSKKCEYVAIHDGARCLVTPEMIKKVFLAAYRYGAATAAKHASDTIKRADKNGFICETVDRSVLWHAQTPQVFKANIYRAAAYIAKKQGDVVTDDCMLAENLGFKVKLVDCTNENIKLTTYDDLYVAEAILRLRRDRKAREKAENGGKK